MVDPQLDIAAMALLERALEQPTGKSREWLQSQTDVGPEIKQRALDLLAAMPSASARLSTGAAAQYGEDIAPPERIGAYKVVEMLGQGGMGAVFKAERDAGDFEHLVAIKLVRPGILSPRLVERFERERQILAGLSHPGIARLYDGGKTPEGGPYIVMEFIDGVPIDRWAQDQQLQLAARLQLLRKVCDAVSFAHQNLIIHRDLTPNNVLVTTGGEPKLIDFGIAKPQDDDPGAELTSSLSLLSLTPGFAAPERYTGAPATTLSDIYSIGKLLEQLVREHSLDEDLRAIIDKATAEVPTERYATSNELSRDLERYLRDFPVSARPISRMMVARKFYQRNRLPVLASVSGIAILFAALLTAGGAYWQAETARAAEATRVTQLRQLANYMLFDHNRELSQVIGNGEARAALVDKAQSYLLTLSELAEGDPSLKLDTALGFIELARIQGVSAQPNFGEHDLAKQNLERAETLLSQAGPSSDAEIAAALARSGAFRALILMHADSDQEAANAAIEGGLKALEQVTTSERTPSWYEARSDLRKAQMEASDLDMNGATLSDLVIQFREELGEWPAELTNSPRGKLEQARIEYYDATRFSYGDALDPPRSLSGYRKAEELYAAFLKRYPNDPEALYWRAWNAYYGHAVAAQTDQPDEADALLNQAQQTIAQLRLIEERDESLVRFSELLREARADLDARMGRFESALAGQQAIVDERAAITETTPTSSRFSDLAYGHVVLADIARRAGERARACTSYNEAERTMAIVDGNGDLRGYVGKLRPGVQANIKRCESGKPVSSFSVMGEE